MELVVHRMTHEADGVLSVELVSPTGGLLPEWAPGAHVDVRLSADLVRQYSLCGDPADAGRYRLGILREEAGRGGSAYVHASLRPGHRVTVDGPRNHFAFEPAPSSLFIAGGIGITPILPMVARAARLGIDWRLVYGGRSLASMAFVSELATHGDRVVLVPQDREGLLDLDALLGAAAPDAAVYCCGPEPLIAAVEAHCAERPGLSLHVERFVARPGALTSSDSDEGFEVVCARSALTVPVGADQSILGALAEAGIVVESSCEEGICGTCETRVLEGRPDHRDSLLSETEREAGDTMMICVSRACSDRLVLDV